MHRRNLRIFVGYAVLGLLVVFTVVVLLHAGEEGRRYHAELVGYDPVAETSARLGGEWLVFSEDKVFYRFAGGGGNSHMEQITGTVVLRLGNFYRIVTEQIKISGEHANGEELGESLALFEGEHVAGRRYDINGVAVCLVVANAELMRCMARGL